MPRQNVRACRLAPRPKGDGFFKSGTGGDDDRETVDRRQDAKERTGLEWLIPVLSGSLRPGDPRGKPRFRPGTAFAGGSEVICIELDMIPGTDGTDFGKRRRYARRVIGITAEATFERAMQAMNWAPSTCGSSLSRRTGSAGTDPLLPGTGESARMDSRPPSASPPSPIGRCFAEEEAKPATSLDPAGNARGDRSPHRFLQNYPFLATDPASLSDAVVALFPGLARRLNRRYTGKPTG